MALPDDYRQQSRARWGAQAAGWEACREAWRLATMPVSMWLIDALDPQPGQTLLELAAGTGDTGLLAAELLEPGGTLISSDFAPEMLRAAQRRAVELGIGNVRFKQVDAESIDQPAASLDGVLCRWGYMLAADSEAALRETRRVLKPGARVALAAWSSPAENPWARLPSHELVERGLLAPVDPDLPGQFAWASSGMVAARLQAAGFTEHHVQALDFAFRFRSGDEWWALVQALSATVSSAVAAAPRGEIDAFRAALDRHAEQFAAADGSLVLPARTWVAWASP